MRRARSEYTASCAKACPYSLIARAQALAEEMMASISPDASCGVHASILRRMSSRPPWLSLKCVRRAPQQPVPAAYTAWMPAASSTRSVARSILGNIAGCTQPCSINTLRVRAARAVSAIRPLTRAGTLFFRILGNNGRNACPSRSAGANQDEVSPCRKDQRTALSIGGRSTRSSTNFLPISTKCPYSTPLGQVVWQLRQVKQRSKCVCVLRVTSAPSSICLMR